MSNSEKLTKIIQKKLDNWNERSSFTIKGVKNLSRSDLETILLYVKAYEKSGEVDFGGLVYPRGYLNQVLQGYEIGIKAKSII